MSSMGMVCAGIEAGARNVNAQLWMCITPPLTLVNVGLEGIAYFGFDGGPPVPTSVMSVGCNVWRRCLQVAKCLDNYSLVHVNHCINFLGAVKSANPKV